MDEFTASGVSVFALSYDEQDALADFRDAYGITFTLLSDPDSAVIRSFGILNTLINENDHPWFGIPFPGTYVMDSAGVISHKFFENSLFLRVGPEPLLQAATGAQLSHTKAASSPPTETKWQVSLEGDQLAVGVLRDVVARIEVPAGRHLYATPAPAGNVPVELVLHEDPSIVVRELVRPASSSHTLGGTGEVIQVYEGAVELRLPIALNGDAAKPTAESHELTLSGELRWQTCDDQVCDIPRRETFTITIPTIGSVPSELGASVDGDRVRAMNGMKHFERMSQRRQ